MPTVAIFSDFLLSVTADTLERMWEIKRGLVQIGTTTFRPESRVGDQPVRIGEYDRLHHLYLIGRTGVGKSTLLRSLISQDIASDQGCALLDPHGDLVEAVVRVCWLGI